jgi:hypothetical protein
MNTKLKSDGNPVGNVGAIFAKIGKVNDYFLIKVTLDGKNHTLVAFPAKELDNEEILYDKNPAYFIFPYKPKDKTLTDTTKINENQVSRI